MAEKEVLSVFARDGRASRRPAGGRFGRMIDGRCWERLYGLWTDRHRRGLISFVPTNNGDVTHNIIVSLHVLVSGME
jgi:hypothetical protein